MPSPGAVVTSEAAADAARRRRRRQTEQESAAAAPPVATVEAKLVSAVEAKPGAAQVTTVEAVTVWRRAVEGAEQQEEAPLQ